MLLAVKKKYSYLGTLLPLALLLAFLVLPAHVQYVLFLTLAMYLFCFFMYRKESATFKWMIFIGLTLRILLVITDEWFGPILQHQPDVERFRQEAMHILDNKSYNMYEYYNVTKSTNLRSYAKFSSIIYHVFSDHTILMRLINVWIAILAIVLIYKLTRLTFSNERIALMAMGLAMFWPSLIVFTSYAIRDSITVYLNTLFVFYIVKSLKGKRSLYNILMIVVLLLLNGIFRIQNLYLFVLILAVFLTWIVLNSKHHFLYKTILISFAVFFIIYVFVFFHDFTISIITYPLRAQPFRAEGGSAYLVDMKINNYWDLIKYTPIRFVYFTFGPFLWHVRTVFQLFSALEGIGLLLTFIGMLYVFIKNRHNDPHHIQLFLFFFCMLGLLANSTVDSNFGTAVRHRISYIIYFFIFSSVWLNQRRIRWLS